MEYTDPESGKKYERKHTHTCDGCCFDNADDLSCDPPEGLPRCKDTIWQEVT